MDLHEAFSPPFRKRDEKTARRLPGTKLGRSSNAAERNGLQEAREHHVVQAVMQENPISRTPLSRAPLATMGLLLGFASSAATAAPLVGHAAPPTVSMVQLLAEIELALAEGRPADAAPVFTLAFERQAQGEPWPAGVRPARLRLAGAAAFFAQNDWAEAERFARAVGAENNATATERAEADWVLALVFLRSERLPDALPLLERLESSAAHRDLALLYRASVLQAQSLWTEAAAAYERYLAVAPRDARWGEAALSRVIVQLKAGELEAARVQLAGVRHALHLVDNLAGLERVSLELGDAWLGLGDAEAALEAYEIVSTHQELLSEQAERIRGLQERLAQAEPTRSPGPDQAENRRLLRQRLEASEAALRAVETDERYDQRVRDRRAEAFLRADQPWEAALLWEANVADFPTAPEVPRWYQSLIRAYLEARRDTRAERVLHQYLEVGPLDATLAETAIRVVEARADRPAEQLVLVETILPRFAGSAWEERLALLQAHVLFALGRYADVRAHGERMREQFPLGALREETAYLHAMAGLVEGGSERARTEIAAFIAAYPDSRFLPDAQYRLATAHYGTEDYATADQLCATWLDEQPSDHPQRGEVLALAGDSAAAQDRANEAIRAYDAALQHPLGDELLGYVLDELTRLYEQQGRPADAAAAWERLAAQQPQHPLVLQGAHWIARLRARAGEPASAVPTLVDIVSRFIDRHDVDGVEAVLAQVAALMLRSRTADLLAAEPVEQCHVFIERAARWWPSETATAEARRACLREELGRLLKLPAVEQESRGAVAAFRPGVLPPALLVRAGEYWLERNEFEMARTYFQELLSRHPRSVFADGAYVGLGELSLRAQEWSAALSWFEQAIDRAGARFKLLEATRGRARALLALGRWEDARSVFEQIASNRAWRGEATVESLFSLGEIHFRQGGAAHLAQAHAHYQRVYLSYRKYTSWVLRAYLRSAEALERLGQTSEAMNTLRELLRDEVLRSHPDAGQATARLIALESGQGGGEA